MTIDTPPGDDRFGFFVVGGKDEGSQCQVEEVHPGEMFIQQCICMSA